MVCRRYGNSTVKQRMQHGQIADKTQTQTNQIQQIMARNTGPLQSGKLGNIIFYTVRGRQYVRVVPTKVRNPKTAQQQAHRNAFAEISRLSSDLADAHRIGLADEARHRQLNTFSVFKHLNKNVCAAGIDYASVVVSQGHVAKAEITQAVLDGSGLLTVGFDGVQSGGSARDEFLLFVYSPASRLCLPVEAVSRASGSLTVKLPGTHFPLPLHLYAFLVDSRGRTSDTIYHFLQ